MKSRIRSSVAIIVAVFAIIGIGAMNVVSANAEGAERWVTRKIYLDGVLTQEQYVPYEVGDRIVRDELPQIMLLVEGEIWESAPPFGKKYTAYVIDATAPEELVVTSDGEYEISIYYISSDEIDVTRYFAELTVNRYYGDEIYETFTESTLVGERFTEDRFDPIVYLAISGDGTYQYYWPGYLPDDDRELSVFHLDKFEPKTLIISSDGAKNTLNLYYVSAEDAPVMVGYTANIYIDGEFYGEMTLKGPRGGIISADCFDAFASAQWREIQIPIPGELADRLYSFELDATHILAGVEPEEIVLSGADSENAINVYYERDKYIYGFGYSFEYQAPGEEGFINAERIGTAYLGDVIGVDDFADPIDINHFNFVDHVYENGADEKYEYIAKKTIPDKLTIGEDEGKNQITVVFGRSRNTCRVFYNVTDYKGYVSKEGDGGIVRGNVIPDGASEAYFNLEKYYIVDAGDDMSPEALAIEGVEIIASSPERLTVEEDDGKNEVRIECKIQDDYNLYRVNYFVEGGEFVRYIDYIILPASHKITSDDLNADLLKQGSRWDDASYVLEKIEQDDANINAYYAPVSKYRYQVAYLPDIEFGGNEMRQEYRTVYVPAEQETTVTYDPKNDEVMQRLSKLYTISRIENETITATDNEFPEMVVVLLAPKSGFSYTVEYRVGSGDGEKLAEDKVVSDRVYDRSYVEFAPEIDGYTPDRVRKAISITGGDDVLVFVYSNKGTAPQKSDPSETSKQTQSADGNAQAGDAITFPIAQGAKNEHVKAVQEKLIADGNLNDVADGVFGKKTKAAVEAFQSEHGLKPTGIVDEDTYVALMN